MEDELRSAAQSLKHTASETVIERFKRRFGFDEEGKPINWKKFNEESIKARHTEERVDSIALLPRFEGPPGR